MYVVLVQTNLTKYGAYCSIVHANVLFTLILKGVTLHSCLCFHPQPQSRSWPTRFRASPLDHTKNLALTLDYPALTTPIDRLESLWLWLSCPRFIPWPLDQLQNSTLTIWPHFDPGCRWEYSRLYSVSPLILGISRLSSLYYCLYKGYHGQITPLSLSLQSTRLGGEISCKLQVFSSKQLLPLWVTGHFQGKMSW